MALLVVLRLFLRLGRLRVKLPSINNGIGVIYRFCSGSAACGFVFGINILYSSLNNDPVRYIFTLSVFFGFTAFYTCWLAKGSDKAAILSKTRCSPYPDISPFSTMYLIQCSWPMLSVPTLISFVCLTIFPLCSRIFSFSVPSLFTFS